MDDGHGPFVVGTQQEEPAAEETEVQQPEPVQVNPNVEQVDPQQPRRTLKKSILNNLGAQHVNQLVLAILKTTYYWPT